MIITWASLIMLTCFISALFGIDWGENARLQTYPDSVHLGQQFGVVLLHGFQTLKHGGDMRLTQQESIIWEKKQKQNWIKNGFIIDSFEWKLAETHHYSIFVCVTDAWAEVGVEPTVCDPVNCGGASARPWSFHLRSASHCSVRAPNDWTEVKKRDRQIGWIIFRTFRTTNQILIS